MADREVQEMPSVRKIQSLIADSKYMGPHVRTGERSGETMAAPADSQQENRALVLLSQRTGFCHNLHAFGRKLFPELMRRGLAAESLTWAL